MTETQHIYLLPGTMCDHRLWSAMISELENISPNGYKFHYLTIGQQESIDELLVDIKRQICRQTDDKITLLGFSLGGYLASAFAVKYPEMLARLLVVSSLPTELPSSVIKERSRTVTWIKQNGYRGIARKRVLALLDDSNQSNEDIIHLIEDMDKRLGGDVLVHQLLVTTQRDNLFDKLRALPLKKAFCVGRNDNLVSVEPLSRAQAEDEHMYLEVFENTGHMLPLEQAENMARWLHSIC